jgi:hypothetical protein
MIYNSQTTSNTTSTNKVADTVLITVEESGAYNLDLQDPTQDAKLIEIAIDENSVGEFQINIQGDNLLCNSVVMNSKKSHIQLRAVGDKWRVHGVRQTIINK